MDSVLALMIKIFDPQGVDWLGFKETRDNPYTYHHLIKKCDKGPRNLYNGAILTKKGQQFIHSFETKDPQRFIELNLELLELNREGVMDYVASGGEVERPKVPFELQVEAIKKFSGAKPNHKCKKKKRK